MASAGESADWLPPGFTEKIKHKNGRKIKYYYNVATGKKHYSRKDVLRAIADDGLHVSPQTNESDKDGLCDNENADNMPVETEDPDEGLPEGWEVEEKVYKSGPRKGSSYKVYIEWSSGRKFYSKEAVDQYLNTSNHANTATTKNEKKEIKGGPGNKTDDVGFQAQSNDAPEWLPQGWTMEVRQRIRDSLNGGSYKVYIEGSSGKKFYSRPDVTRYLNSLGRADTTTVQNEDTADDSQLGTPQTANGKKGVNNVSVKTNDTSQWLPEGWKVEEKPRKSGSSKQSSYKIYTELSTGSKFYSRPDVIRYLNTVNPANDTAVQNDIGDVDKSFPSGQISEMKSTSNSEKVTTEKTTVDDLPPGWIKEIRTKKSGSKIRKDPFYIDPVSGYVFRSKLDALRYVETNDISRCACRPFKRESHELNGELFGGETSDKKSPVSKSKKRRDIGLASRTSKRRAEMPSSLEPAHVEEDTSSPNIEPEANRKKPEEETDVKDGEKELEDVKKSPESQLGYDFGDSWSDPVDFALKTLCGEMPIEDNLPFPGSSKLPQSEKSPIISKSDFVPFTESSLSPSPGKRHGALALLQSNPALFSGEGNQGCNGQSSTKGGKEDHGAITKPWEADQSRKFNN